MLNLVISLQFLSSVKFRTQLCPNFAPTLQLFLNLFTLKLFTAIAHRGYHAFTQLVEAPR
jgi:hypothetical protein